MLGLDDFGLCVILGEKLRPSALHHPAPHAEDVLEERRADCQLKHRVDERDPRVFRRGLAVDGGRRRARSPGDERGLDEMAPAVHGNLLVRRP